MKKLRKVLEEKGKQQVWIAKETGIRLGRVKNIAKLESNPTNDEIAIISKLLDINPDEIDWYNDNISGNNAIRMLEQFVNSKA